MSSDQRRAQVALGLGVFCIAWSALFVRWSDVPGSVSAFYRLAVAALVLVPWRVLNLRAQTRPTRAAMRASVIAGLWFAADLALFNTAIMKTSATTATLLGCNTPIFVAFGARFIFKERLPRAFYGGLAVAVTGAVLIIGRDLMLEAAVGVWDLVAVLAAFAYAGYLIATQRGRGHTDAVTFNAFVCAVGAVALLLLVVAFDMPLSGFAPSQWAALLGLGLVCQLIGHVLIAYAMGQLPATVSSVTLLGQAPATAVLAVLLLGERLGPIQVTGGILVLAGIYMVNRSRTVRFPVPTTPDG